MRTELITEAVRCPPISWRDVINVRLNNEERQACRHGDTSGHPNDISMGIDFLATAFSSSSNTKRVFSSSSAESYIELET